MQGDTLDDAVQYVRSVAFRRPGREGYSFGTIMEELAKYQRTDDETYAAFALRFMSPAEIERVWREEARRASAACARRTTRK